MQDKKEINKRPGGFFLVLLFGFFYLNLRLVVSSIIMFSMSGSYALTWTKDIPYFTLVFNVTAACAVVLAVTSICLVLAGKPSGIRGLRRTIVCFLLLIIFIPFHYRAVMWGMVAFLLLFYAYLLFSGKVRRNYPLEGRRHSAVGKAAGIVLILLPAFMLVIYSCRFVRAGRSLPHDINTVTVTGNTSSDGYCRFGFPEGWQRDSLIYAEDGYPVTRYHGKGASIALVRSYISTNRERSSHNILVPSMAPAEESSIKGPTMTLDTLLASHPVYYSEYSVNGTEKWGIATIFDPRSYKATSISILMPGDTCDVLKEMIEVLGTVDFNLDGDLLEE